MKIEGQVRKAAEQFSQAILAGEYVKAVYIAALIQQMHESFTHGIPQPWSQFAPMVDEEFS